MSIHIPGKKSGKTKRNRVWFRFLKSSEYRQFDFFITLLSGDACRHPVQLPEVVGQGGNQ